MSMSKMKDNKKNINEILAYFEEYVKMTELHDSEPMLDWLDLKIVLDYISNLKKDLKFKEEMEREFNEKHTKLIQDYSKLQQGNEKFTKFDIHYIMFILNDIILQLKEIKNDEDSVNEGSLTDSEFYELISKFNIILKELINYEEN